MKPTCVLPLCVLGLLLVVGSGDALTCEPIGSLPAMCPAGLFGFSVPSTLDQHGAEGAITTMRNQLLDLVRHATQYKKQYCMEAVASLACYHTFEKCDEGDKAAVPPCGSVCAKAAELCGVKAADLHCDELFPAQTGCHTARLVDSPPCAVPTRDQAPFCDMVRYPAGKSFFGNDFAKVDSMAKDSYEGGSEMLPSLQCRESFKYLLCEAHFRRCDADGLDLPPCRRSCLDYARLGCNGAALDADRVCEGPQYADTNCNHIDVPVVFDSCAVPDGLPFCNMVDYPVSTSITTAAVDKTVNSGYGQLVVQVEAQTGVKLSGECKSALRDLSCAATLRKCDAEDPHHPPMSLCRSMCEHMAAACGVDPAGRCESFPEAACFSVEPSTRRYCVADWMCPGGEYCFKSSLLKGVCLAKPARSGV